VDDEGTNAIGSGLKTIVANSIARIESPIEDIAFASFEANGEHGSAWPEMAKILAAI
jgi:hypothetical protein